MTESRISCMGLSMREYRLDTVVVGTGAAGYNAACRLDMYGQKNIAIVTEGIGQGTSRNTGSDKQTYYKLTLSGCEADSVREMAQTLYEGRCVDGDVALCEAALSAQSFLRLAELGIPFPRNRWGEYVGYKTDHDPARRATSVGPYTSRIMTECLQKEAEAKKIPVFDGFLVIRILVSNDVCRGLLCLDLHHLEREDMRYAAFRCENVIWATGGPAGMYQDSVYPYGHFGATGTAFAAGVMGRNLTEWQYGLASVKPRWNVSGTYMQVLPRMISTEADGSDEREFLYDYVGTPESGRGTETAPDAFGQSGPAGMEAFRPCFSSESDLLTRVFLKGYQWPFDVRKVDGGSSVIDILVYLETKKGRRVFLDYRKNPGSVRKGELDFPALGEEAYRYLSQAGACFGTPYERLCHMNRPAVDFYLGKGVDLSKEPLEIALCAQHNNGGLAVDAWWRSNVKGLFAAGEAAGSHGVYRPGGSALNAGQVGSTRAAQYIAAMAEKRNETFGDREEEAQAADGRAALEMAVSEAEELTRKVLDGGSGESDGDSGCSGSGEPDRDRGRSGAGKSGGDNGHSGTGEPDRDSGRSGAGESDGDSGDSGTGEPDRDSGRSGAGKSGGDNGDAARSTVAEIWRETAADMSGFGAAIRNEASLQELLGRVKERRENLLRGRYRAALAQLPMAFRLRDMLLCQEVYLESMLDYLRQGGKSRGSALYTDPRGIRPYRQLPETFTYRLEEEDTPNRIQEVVWDGEGCRFSWRDPRPIPEDDDFFENVWRGFRENGNVY